IIRTLPDERHVSGLAETRLARAALRKLVFRVCEGRGYAAG
ncbi:MAG: hypothetical protein RLZ98_3687, partial [Pseudomonadota bacterium]